MNIEHLQRVMFLVIAAYNLPIWIGLMKYLLNSGRRSDER